MENEAPDSCFYFFILLKCTYFFMVEWNQIIKIFASLKFQSRNSSCTHPQGRAQLTFYWTYRTPQERMISNLLLLNLTKKYCFMVDYYSGRDYKERAHYASFLFLFFYVKRFQIKIRSTFNAATNLGVEKILVNSANLVCYSSYTYLHMLFGAICQ